MLMVCVEDLWVALQTSGSSICPFLDSNLLVSSIIPPFSLKSSISYQSQLRHQVQSTNWTLSIFSRTEMFCVASPDCQSKHRLDSMLHSFGQQPVIKCYSVTSNRRCVHGHHFLFCDLLTGLDRKIFKNFVFYHVSVKLFEISCCWCSDGEKMELLKIVSNKWF